MTDICHKVRCAQDAPLHWRAKCGFKFGAALFDWTKQAPSDYKLLCDKCFYHERLAIKGALVALEVEHCTRSV